MESMSWVSCLSFPVLAPEVFFPRWNETQTLYFEWSDSNLIQSHNDIIQLLHAVTGSMAFCTLEGAIFPRECTKPMDPSHSMQQLCCYTYNCYSSSRSSVIFKHYYDDPLFNKQTNKKQFPRTRGCFVHSAGNRPTPGTIKVMYTGLHHFMVPDPSSHVTCVFVARHMVGSRPIKLHSLLPRYNNDSWTTLNRFQELWS